MVSRIQVVDAITTRTKSRTRSLEFCCVSGRICGHGMGARNRHIIALQNAGLSSLDLANQLSRLGNVVDLLLPVTPLRLMILDRATWQPVIGVSTPEVRAQVNDILLVIRSFCETILHAKDPDTVTVPYDLIVDLFVQHGYDMTAVVTAVKEN